MRKLFDVIIVGSGPAGSMSAYELSMAGLDVLILEKEKLPRYKVCGGGIQFKMNSIIPFNFDEVSDCTIKGIRFSRKLGNGFQRKYRDAIMFTVMRDKFDNYLTEKAISVGADLQDNTCAEGLEISNGKVKVKTSKGYFHGKVIIGADGANSTIAKLQNLKPSTSQSIGLESEIIADQEIMAAFRDIIHLDWGTIPRGYAWVFPKKDHLSVGVGGPSSLIKPLKKYKKKYLEFLGLERCETLSSRGHILPIRESGRAIFNNHSILVGDAAGLIDPFTGEGLWGAIKSAQIASSCIIQNIKNNSPLSDYQKRIDSEIMPELKASTSVMHFFNTAPRLFHNYLKNSDHAWDAMCKILRGEKNFLDIEHKFGQLKFVWNACSSIFGCIENIKIRMSDKNK